MKKQREISKGDIYWSNQPFVKGHVQKGSRPYLVISTKNDKGYATVFPVTSKIKEIPNRFDIAVKGKHNQVICDQPQTVPISTLGRYFDSITWDDVDSCLSVMLMLFNYVCTDNKEAEFWQELYFDSLDEDECL